MLNGLGANISGIGTNCPPSKASSLSGGTHRINDYLEVGRSGARRDDRLAAHHRGGPAERYANDQLVFRKLGVDEMGAADHQPGGQRPKIQMDMGNQVPKIDDAPWPAFPTDMMSVAITTATQCEGMVMFFEKMFDGRMFFTDSLVGMGARIILCDPHRVVVSGRSALVGSTVSSPDVREGVPTLLAALTAKGTSTIYNIRHIDRGYERIEQKLQALGARIERQPA